MHKKAQLTMPTLIGIVFGLLVVFIFGVAALKGGSIGGRDKAFLSKDVGLVIDSLYATYPGAEVDAKYTIHFPDIKVVARNNEVQAMASNKDPRPGELAGALYHYAQHNSYKYLDEEVLSDSLFYHKDVKAVELRMVTLPTETCPVIDTRADEIWVLVKNDADTKNIGDMLKAYLMDKSVDETKATMTIELAKGQDGVVVRSGGTEELVKQKSQKLGCLIGEQVKTRLSIEPGIGTTNCAQPCATVEVAGNMDEKEVAGIIYAAIQSYQS